MSALKELLATLLSEELINDDVNGRVTEAYEFDMSDYTEQLGASQAAEGESAVNIAALTEQVAALTGEVNAVKAMNFDELVNGKSDGKPSGGDGGDAGSDYSENPMDDPDISLDELIELSTKEKE